MATNLEHMDTNWPGEVLNPYEGDSQGPEDAKKTLNKCLVNWRMQYYKDVSSETVQSGHFFFKISF